MKKLLLTVIVLVACIFCLSSCGVFEKFFPCKHENTVTDAAVAATCTESGLTEGSHCAKCGETVVAQETISALGHKEVTDAAKEPNCTDTGLTECKHCSVCNAVTVAQETINALGHTQVIDDAVAATCTEDGLTAGAHCTVCDDVVIAQEVIPAAHSWGEWVATAEGDCFFAGAETRICSACEEEESRAVAVLAHSFVMNEETQLYYCELCDARIYAGHLYAAFDVQMNWYDAYKECTALGGHLVTITSQGEQEFLTAIINSRTVPTDVSNYYYWTSGLQNGENWIWTTGEDFAYTNWSKKEPDGGGKHWYIALATSRVESVNAHAKVGEWEDSVHFYKYGFICEWELDLNCDEHIFTEWEALTEATCFADGQQYRICTYCGYEEYEDITQLEHNFVFNEATGINGCEHCDAAMYNGKIYKIFEISLSWFDAYAYCEDLGGHIVTITSEEEQTFIETFMNANSYTSRTWLGGYNDGDSFKWVTEEAFEYTNWYTGQPDCDGGTGYFVAMNWDSSYHGRWHDHSPLSNKYFICEWEATE